MGYTTQFKGRLNFTFEATLAMIRKLEGYFGADGRELTGDKECEFTYIDLVLCDDYKGVQWDSGTEKNRGMVDAVNFIIAEMKKDFPEFGLKGEFIAQGEDIEDLWKLVFENGVAMRQAIEISGQKCNCPECGHKWIQE